MAVNGFQPPGLKFANPSPKGLVGFQRQGMDMRKKGGGSGSLTTWNPADIDPNAALDPSLLILSLPAGSGTHRGCRSTTSKSGGLWHAEFIPTGSNSEVPGLYTGGASLGQFPGQGLGAGYITDGRIYVNGVQVDAISAYSGGTVVAMEYDAGANAVYFRAASAGGWSGPYALGAIGPCFIGGGVYDAGDTITLNAGRSAFTIAPSPGYSAWGG